MPDIRIKRGTRAQIDAAATAGQLAAGQPLLITDESRFAVATGASAYQAAAKEGEGGSATLSKASSSLAADVQLPVSSTWYDGPSVSLAAGTWLVNSHVTLVRTATTALTYFSRISTGTTHYASGQHYHASLANHSVMISLCAIITLGSTTTVKIQTTTNAGATTALMKAALTANGSGNNATTITAVRVA